MTPSIRFVTDQSAWIVIPTRMSKLYFYDRNGGSEVYLFTRYRLFMFLVIFGYELYCGNSKRTNARHTSTKDHKAAFTAPDPSNLKNIFELKCFQLHFTPGGSRYLTTARVAGLILKMFVLFSRRFI